MTCTVNKTIALIKEALEIVKNEKPCEDSRATINHLECALFWQEMKERDLK